MQILQRTRNFPRHNWKYHTQTINKLVDHEIPLTFLHSGQCTKKWALTRSSLSDAFRLSSPLNCRSTRVDESGFEGTSSSYSVSRHFFDFVLISLALVFTACKILWFPKSQSCLDESEVSASELCHFQGHLLTDIFVQSSSSFPANIIFT